MRHGGEFGPTFSERLEQSGIAKAHQVKEALLATIDTRLTTPPLTSANEQPSERQHLEPASLFEKIPNSVRLGAAATLAAVELFTAACKTSPTPGPTQSIVQLEGTVAALKATPTISAAKNESRQPTARPAIAAATVKPALSEGQTSTEEREAKQFALSYMLGLLNTKQDISQQISRGVNNVSLTSNTANLGSFPIYELTTGKQLPPEATLLNFKWDFKRNTDNPYETTRTRGEGEIKDIVFVTNPMAVLLNLSNADRANGIKWTGTPNINFVFRYRLTKEYGANAFDRFAGTLPDPTAPFSPWQEGIFSLTLLQRNGRFEISANWPGPQYYPINSDIISGKCGTTPECQAVRKP